MAGQKRSSISSDSDLSRYQSYEFKDTNPKTFGAEDEISQESGLDQAAYNRIELLAKVRGVSPQNLISEILLEHLSKVDPKESSLRKLHPRSDGIPLRFVDPADQISLDEDFRELAS